MKPIGRKNNKRLDFIWEWQPLDMGDEEQERFEQELDGVSKEVAIEFLKSLDVEYMRKLSDRTFDYMFDEWNLNRGIIMGKMDIEKK